jgi:beta-N-acetylhexosaminidase
VTSDPVGQGGALGGPFSSLGHRDRSQAHGAGSRVPVWGRAVRGACEARNKPLVFGEKIGRYTAELMIDRRTLLSALLSLGTSESASIRLAAKSPDPASEVRGLSLDQMIGKMIVMGFWGSDPASPGAQTVSLWLKRGDIGGVIFFEDNLLSPRTARDLTRYFRESAGSLRPFLCVDQEGGAVARLRADRGFEPLPAARSLATTSPHIAAVFYNRTADELRHLGFNVNFGPVVDLALNHHGPIANLGRSYGRDPAMVIEYAKTFINAHRRNHVATALKHFPGLGSTSADSHRSLPKITATWSPDEMRPFAELVEDGYADMVMMAHVVHSDLTEANRPASLSTQAIENVLRERLHHDGVVVADDMQMGAITRSFTPDESILLGIEAGLDLFIYSNRQHPDPQMPERFHRVTKAAVDSNRLPLARIHQSVCRILRLERSMGYKEQ